MGTRKPDTEWRDRFAVRDPAGFRLTALATDAASGIEDKKAAKAALADVTARLSERQQVLYAQAQHALLVVLQAMDTGGKDGTIRHVFGPINPQGIRVTSFKTPTAEELAHDYLWRIHAAVPAKGMIGVFNRSHYEDVLIARVHRLAPAANIAERYDQINAFEQYLTRNGVTIVKICLHIGKDAQKDRLQSRLDHPAKHWKFSARDLAERQLWTAYQRAYQKAIVACSTPWAPWYVIPADRKWYRNLAVAQVVRETLESLDLRYPDPEPGLDEIVIDS